MHNNYSRYSYLWSTLLGCHLYSWVDCRYSPNNNENART